MSGPVIMWRVCNVVFECIIDSLRTTHAVRGILIVGFIAFLDGMTEYNETVRHGVTGEVFLYLFVSVCEWMSALDTVILKNLEL